MNEFGPAEVLVDTEVADPVPDPGQALIEVEFVNVTFVETKIRAGRPPRASMLPELPVIPGNGVGGVVDGRRVISSTGGSGAYAERVAVDAQRLIPVPDGVALKDAVALLSDGRTAIGRAAFELLRPGGRHCAFGMASGSFAPIDEPDAGDRGVTLVRGAVLDPAQMNRLTEAALAGAAGGQLRPVIGQTFPLERAADAHRAIETRATIGKTLLATRGGAG
jgi:NADPH2:quinone reductase